MIYFRVDDISLPTDYSPSQMHQSASPPLSHQPGSCSASPLPLVHGSPLPTHRSRDCSVSPVSLPRSRSGSVSPVSTHRSRSRSVSPVFTRRSRSHSVSPVSTHQSRSRSGSPVSTHRSRSCSVSPVSTHRSRSRSMSPVSTCRSRMSPVSPTLPDLSHQIVPTHDGTSSSKSYHMEGQRYIILSLANLCCMIFLYLSNWQTGETFMLNLKPFLYIHIT